MTTERDFIKDRGKRIVPLLEEVYGNMTHDDLMVSAYQLKFLAPEEMLFHRYGHIIFNKGKIDRGSIQWVIDNISRPNMYEDYGCTFNVQFLELLICLKHMLLKDRIKVIFDGILSESTLGFTTDYEDDINEDLKEEIRMMRNAGYTDPKALMKEREEEIEKYYNLHLLDLDVKEYFVDNNHCGND